MESTTIFYPQSISGFTVYSLSGTNTILNPISATTDASSTLPATLTGDFTLYLAISASPSVTAVSLVQALAAEFTGSPISVPVYVYDTSVGSAVPVTTWTTVTFSNNELLYIPVRRHLPTTVHLPPLVTALYAAASSTIPATGSTSSSVPTTNPQHTSTGSSNNSGNTSISGTASTSPTRTGQSSTTTLSGGSKGISDGAVTGGIVGAFVGGILLALLAFWCMRRRSPRRTLTQAGSDDSSQGKVLTRDASNREKPQVGVIASDLTGWQKHLPQDKDDRTIAQAFQSVFEHVQIHMEGFYEAKPGPILSAAIETLQRVSSDDLPRMLPQTKDAIPFLEGTLARYIIHRISGRSSVEESFLPLEFTKIPESNEWHMENDLEGNGSVAESKRGFPQAFSQWRRLTGFLGPDPRTDQAFKRDLNAKIDKAVETLTEAFAPWESRGKSSENRRESLRKILLQASDAGVLLFTQPSTFMYDWSVKDSGEDRTLVVTPALVKRLDESAEAFRQVQVLVEARRARI